MSELGGATTQSGVFYQNSISALYLGELIDSAERPPRLHIVAVRVEAPEEVDDTVVIFADEHKLFIQAKENVHENDAPWQKLWRDFKNQFDQPDFKKGKDRMLLVAGTVQKEFHILREICERASTSENVVEFSERLIESQEKIVRRLKSILFSNESSDEAKENFNENDNYLLSLLKHVEVEIWTLKELEQYATARRIPPSNRKQFELFSLLRDRIGGKARVKGIFTREELLSELSETGVEIVAQPSTESLRETIKMSGAPLKSYKGSFGATNVHLEREITAEILQWTTEATFENNFAVLLDQAGMGKTVVAQDVLLGLEDAGTVVMTIKADALSDIANARDLQERLELPDRVERVLDRLAVNERVVLLIDQIDALSLSLAHDQAALDVVLELAARARLIPNLKIIISCRTFDFNNDPRLANLPVNKNFRLPALTVDEIKTVLARIGVQFENLEPATQTLLQIPLHLDLFTRVVAEILAEAADDLPLKLRGLNSLQDLYAGLWRYVVCKDDTRAPKIAARERVLQLIAERMDANQEVSVPQSLITSRGDDELTAAAQWLASQGILIPSKNSWTLLHQTFFDYCYAKNFVESGTSLYETVKNGEQGLFVRSQIVQVLNYWRGVSQNNYLRELHSFLTSTEIRFHLRDHVLRWFGTLPAPTEEEWVIANQFLLSADGERLRLFIRGNAGWFKYLKPGFVRALKSGDDAKIDNEVIPFLTFIFDSEEREITEILRPFLGSSEVWNKRIQRLFWNFQNWSGEAIEFFEEVFRLMPEAERRDFYGIKQIAEIDAKADCRITKIAFDKEIEQIEKQDDKSFGLMYFRNDLEHLNGSSLVEVLQLVSETESEYFLREMLPWLERVLRLSKEPDDNSFFFRSDLLSSGFDYTVYVVLRQIIKSFRTALTNVAKNDRPAFLEFAERLAAMRYGTAQRLLAQTFEQVPKAYAAEALEFLVEDLRRLTLGAAEVFDSRQLIKAVAPHLNQEQSVKLETAVLSLPKFIGFPYKKYPRFSFSYQFYLMHSFPPEKLTAGGRKYFAELQRKFPDLKISERPSLGEGGFVGSPISDGAVEKMSDAAWLAAFRKYSKGTTHKEFLKGGAEQLSSVLMQKTKELPERFYALAMRTPPDTDAAYTAALINGLADSFAPAEKLFEAVRRFSAVENEKTARATASALKKRAKENFPDDLLGILESKARSAAGEDEEGWREEKESTSRKYDTLNSSPYISYLNSIRGAIFRVVMRVLDARDNAKSKRRKWELLEFTAANGSDALKAGVIEELLYVFNDDSEKCVALFENLVNQSPVLLFTHYALEFIYWATPTYFGRMRNFIETAMESEYESVQEHAALLACLVPLYKPISEDSEASQYADDLANKARTSERAACRRGAVNVYASNLKDTNLRALCLDNLIAMLGDSDEQVKRKMSRVFYNADDSQLGDLQTFIGLYAASKFDDDAERDLAEFLWKYGNLEPEWSLSVIETILKNRKTDNQFSRDGEFYVRLVLQIYKMPFVSAVTHRQALDLFDELMRHFTYDASRILNEWDSR